MNRNQLRRGGDASGHDAERPRWYSIILIQLWLFSFIAFAGTTLVVPFAALGNAAVLIYTVPLLAWVVLGWRRPPDRIDAAILLGLAAHLVVSFLSADRPGSLQSTAAVAGFAAAFWAARRIGADHALRQASAISVALALTFWSVVIASTWVVEKVVDLQVLGWPPQLDAYQPYAWGSINTPPVLLILAAPFVAWMPRGWLRTSVIWLLLASAVVIIPFSVGRAAWIGIAIALVSLELLLGSPSIRWLLRRGWPGRAALGLVGLMLVYTVVLVASRGARLADDMLTRLRLWEQALGLFTADPLTGSGPATFGWARLQHAPDFVDRVGVTLAHNVPIQTLADGGLVLLAAFAAVMGAWTWSIGRARASLTNAQRLAVAVLVGYAAFALLDDLSFLPAVTVLLIFIAAWALPSQTRSSRPRSTASGLVVPAAMVAVIACVTPASAALGLLRTELEGSRNAALAGEWESSLHGFRHATGVQPSIALHWMSVGYIEQQLGHDEGARQAYEQARRANPGDARPWGALAALSSDRAEGIRLLQEAARRANDPQYAYRLSRELLAAGRMEEAADALAIATVLHPNLAATAPDELTVQLRQALPAAIDTVGPLERREPREALWNIVLLADEVDPAARPAWAVARAIDAASPSVERMLDHAFAVAPNDPKTRMAAHAAAHLGCDRGAAAETEQAVRLVDREPRLIPHGVVSPRPGLYGYRELGDYQPIAGRSIPELPAWPFGLIEVPECDW